MLIRHKPFRVAARASASALLAVPMVLAASVGCNKSQADIDTSLNTFVQNLLIKRTPQQRAIEALQSENPDDRRKSLAEIVDDKAATEEWAVKLFASMAKTDPDPQVRCIAIKGLRRSADDRAIEPLLMILNHREFPKKVVPPSPEVRWEAAEVIKYMSEYGDVPQEHREWTRRTLTRLVVDDPDRQVRIEAAQALGNYAHPDVLTALVAALDSRDFGVPYHAEKSLERLTGQRHDYNPDAWRAWLAKTPDPFLTSDQQERADVEEVGAGQPATEQAPAADSAGKT